MMQWNQPEMYHLTMYYGTNCPSILSYPHAVSLPTLNECMQTRAISATFHYYDNHWVKTFSKCQMPSAKPMDSVAERYFDNASKACVHW